MGLPDLPSLNSLRAFAVVAATGSFSRAGAELRVSHSAVSQQVKALEARLGVQLVVREGRRIKLTPDGSTLARRLIHGLATISDAVDVVTGLDAPRPVQATMSPAFALCWLMPRIEDFQRRHPKISLMINPTAEIVDLTAGTVDLAIRFGDGDWPSLKVAPFLQPDMVVVGSPDVVRKRFQHELHRVADLPWLQELGTDEVAGWMKRRGIRPRRAPKITQMPGTLIIDAVRRGFGLTYTARCFVDEDIRSGRLVEVFSERNAGSYHIVTRREPLRPPVRAFVAWLRQQATGMRRD